MRARKSLQNIISPAGIAEAVRAMLLPYFDSTRVEDVIAVLEGTSIAVSRKDAELLAGEREARIEPCVTRRELAKLLKVSTRAVDYHLRAGHLEPVYLPGASRCRGYTARSVRAMLAGTISKTAFGANGNGANATNGKAVAK